MDFEENLSVSFSIKNDISTFTCDKFTCKHKSAPSTAPRSKMKVLPRVGFRTRTWGVFHKAVRKVTHDFTNDLYMKSQMGMLNHY